jgi:hypothetical protein
VWQHPDPLLPAPKPLAWAVLTVPPAGAIATQWLSHARPAGSRAVAVAAGVGLTNAMAEEPLWRGAPETASPAARRLISQPGGKLQALFGASLIGFGHGWLAWRTRSLVATSVAHAVTDA